MPVEGGVVDLDRLAAACDARTRIVSLSWVGYATGWRIDVPAGRRACAAAAAACSFSMRFRGSASFRSTCSQRRRFSGGRRTQVAARAGRRGHSVRAARAPATCCGRSMVGWNSVVARQRLHADRTEPAPDAARYEGGSQNMIGLHRPGASLDLLASLGVCADEPRPSPSTSWPSPTMLASDSPRCATLLLRDGEHRSGIVTFSFPAATRTIAAGSKRPASSSAAAPAACASARTATIRGTRWSG